MRRQSVVASAVRPWAVVRKQVHVLHEHPTDDAVHQDERANHTKHDPGRISEWDQGQRAEQGADGDDEWVGAAREEVNAQLMRTRRVVDRFVDLWLRQLHVIPGRPFAGRVGVTPGLEGGGGHVAGGPQLVAAVAAVVDKASRPQPTAWAIHCQAGVGDIDVPRPSGYRHRWLGFYS